MSEYTKAEGVAYQRGFMDGLEYAAQIVLGGWKTGPCDVPSHEAHEHAAAAMIRSVAQNRCVRWLVGDMRPPSRYRSDPHTCIEVHGAGAILEFPEMACWVCVHDANRGKK